MLDPPGVCTIARTPLSRRTLSTVARRHLRGAESGHARRTTQGTPRLRLANRRAMGGRQLLQRVMRSGACVGRGGAS